MNVVYFIRPFNKVLNFPASWENEVLLNTRFYLFHLFNYISVISWRDVTFGIRAMVFKMIFGVYGE